MEFGFSGGAIASQEWDWIRDKCLSMNARSLLEIGSGYSTICFSSIMDRIDSYETSDTFIKELSKVVDNKKVTFIKYNYPVFPKNSNKYDVALVDGPGQNNNNGRMNSMLFSEPLTDYIFIHDFSRSGEKISREKVFNKDKWEILETKMRTLLIKRKPGTYSVPDVSLSANQDLSEPSQGRSESSIRF